MWPRHQAPGLRLGPEGEEQMEAGPGFLADLRPWTHGWFVGEVCLPRNRGGAVVTALQLLCHLGLFGAR